MVSSMDYYQELNVDRQATTAEIRRAYKRLALLWHPDRNSSREAGEKFKTIKHAYDVLIDDKRRRDYDQESQRTSKTYQYTFEQVISTPIDPMDIVADLQFFQESNFTSKMFNSPQYRQFYTELFHSMNAPNRLSCHVEYQNEWFLSEPTDHEHLSAYSWFEK